MPADRLAQWDAVYRAAGERYNVDPALLKALTFHESGGNTQIVSNQGAVGLAQILPTTAAGLNGGRGIDPRDPQQAIMGAAEYLAQGLDKYGDPAKALMYYHGGPNEAIWGPKTKAYVGLVGQHYQKFAAGMPQTMNDASPGGQQAMGSPVRAGDAFEALFDDEPHPAAATPTPSGRDATIRSAVDRARAGVAARTEPAVVSAPSSATPATGGDAFDALFGEDVTPTLPREPATAQNGPRPPRQTHGPTQAVAPVAEVAHGPEGTSALASMLGNALNTLSGLSRRDIAKIYMTPAETSALLAGAGRAVSDVVDKPAELLARGADAVGVTTGAGDRVAASNAAGRAAYEAARGDNTLSQIGRVGGQIAITTPILGGAGRLLGAAGDVAASAVGTVAPAVETGARAVGSIMAGQGMPGTGMLGRAVGRSVAGAEAGAGAAALTAGASDAPVSDQMRMGGLTGMATAPAFAAAAGAARGGINMLMNRAGGVDPDVARLAQLARDRYNIPLRADQIAESGTVKMAGDVVNRLPLSGGAAFDTRQKAAVVREISTALGENAERITPAVMDRARRRIGSDFNTVANASTVRVDQPFVQNMSQVQRDAAMLTPDEFHAVRSQIQNVLGSVNAQGVLPGEVYQSLTRQGTPLDRALQSANPNIRFYAGRVRDALDSLLERNAPPPMVDLIRQARSQWHAMKTIEDMVEKSPTGELNPALLMGAVRGNTNMMAYNGGGRLGDLARISQQFLKAPANSGTPERTVAIDSLKNMGQLAAGAVGLGSAAVAGVAAPALAATGGGLLAGRLVGGALRSDTAVNRLIQAGLNQGLPPPMINQLLSQSEPYAAPVAALIARRNEVAPVR